MEKVTIMDVAAEGKAIAKVNDLVIFVPYVVPGDVVDLQIKRKKNKYAEAEAVKFHELSPNRAVPFCQHYGVCGGCKWQVLPYPEQIRYKQKQVEDNLRRIGKIELPEISPILGSAKTEFYRNKLEFTFSNKRWLTNEEVRQDVKYDQMNAVGFPQLAVQADMQGVLGGVGVIDLTEWPDGRLMEDGRLVPAAFVLALVLNGAQQGELIVIGKGEDIALAVDGSILGGKAVIDLIEFILRFAEVQRVILMGLDADDLQQRGTDFAQALDTGRLHAGVGLGDQLVLLAVVDFAVLHQKGKIPGPVGGILIIIWLFFLRFLQRLHIRLRAETGVQALHCAGKGFIQVETLRRDTGRAILAAVHIPAALHLAHEHFRVVHEVAVVGNPFSPFHVCLYPRWGVCPVKLHGGRPLFQKDNIRGHFGSRQHFERRIGQADGANELCPPCDIFPQALVLPIQYALAGDKGDDAARLGEV